MDHFELVSEFKPTGDQPQAIEELVEGFKKGNQCETLLGVTGSGKTFTMANVIEQLNKPTLIIAHNKTLNALRDRRVLYTASVVSVETENVLNVEDNRIENMPEATIDQQETSRLVREILDVLPDEQRIVIGMFYYDQMSVSEIAEELECSENTVKSRLNYGRKKIQSKVLELEKNGTKLYSLAPLPFFIWLLRNLYRQPDKKIFDAVRQKYVMGKGTAKKKNRQKPVKAPLWHKHKRNGPCIISLNCCLGVMQSPFLRLCGSRHTFVQNPFVRWCADG